MALNRQIWQHCSRDQPIGSAIRSRSKAVLPGRLNKKYLKFQPNVTKKVAKPKNQFKQVHIIKRIVKMTEKNDQI